MAPRISFKVSAPGKVILMGEHSVVYGKTALAASLSLRTHLLFTEIDEAANMFHLFLPGIGLTHRCGFDDIKNFFAACPPPLNGKQDGFNLESPHLIDVNSFISSLQAKIAELRDVTRLEYGQENALIAFFFIFFGMFSGVNLSIVPFMVTITSDLTVGAGTGSSASYGACLASAFYLYIRSRIAEDGNLGKNAAKKDYKPLEINFSDSSKFDEHEMNIILSWALISDQIMHGNPSGIDASVITYGNVIEFRRGEAGKPPTIQRLPGTNALKILLVNTRVSRNTKQLVAGVCALHAKHPKVVDPILDAMNQIALSAKRVFQELQTVQGSIDAAILTGGSKVQEADVRGSHSQQSDEVQGSEKVDVLVANLGELMEMNHSLLRSLFVSHPALDEICSIASRNGLSAKLTGAGGGGYAIVLLPPRLPEDRIVALKSDLKERGYDATFALMGGAGVTLDKYTQLTE